MTEAEFQNFSTAFSRMCGHYRVKLSKNEAMDLTRTYFKLLEPHAFDDVVRTAKTLMETSKRMPLAADWLDLLTKRTSHTAADVRYMTVSEMDEYDFAQRTFCIGQPCLCPDCVRAGVDDHPLRFVPTTYGDDFDIALHTRLNRRLPSGHWAHGEELARWYRERERFTTSTKRFPKLARVLVRVDREREPGEDG
jgi:hypothetical protein